MELLVWKGALYHYIISFVIFHFQPVSGGDFLYLAFPSASRPNNTQAQDICAAYGDYELAIIDSQSEYDRMYTYLNNTLGAGFILPAAIWLGGYWIDVGGNWTHFWRKCDQDVKMTWTYWDGGEPNSPGYENCLRVHTNMYLRTINCYSRYDVLCEKMVYSSGGCEETVKKEECKILTPCWWTPAKIGLTAGFTSLTVFICACCIGWKCICEPKNQVGYEHEGDDDDDDDDDCDVGNDTQPSTSKPHNILKNYNMDAALFPSIAPPTINSMVLRKEDAPWMSPEELSFSARYAYKE